LDTEETRRMDSILPRCSDGFMSHTGVKVPKRTIHSFVQEIGKQLGGANEAKANCEESSVVMVDGRLRLFEGSENLLESS